MAAAMRAFIGLTIVAALVQPALGVNYAVGGAGGWNLGGDFQTWASSQSFKTGDSISFSYPSLHSVVEVSKAEYDACSLSNPIKVHNDGNTVVKLSSPGKRYFICGAAGHCSGGMKVAVNTVSAAVSTPPPAPLVTPPATSPPAVSTPPPAPLVTPPATSPPAVSTPPPAPLVTPPAASPPAMHSDAPSVSPSGAPVHAPSTGDSPSSTPVLTPTASRSGENFPETAPTPQASAANNFGPLAKIGSGLAAGMLIALVL